MKIPFFLIFLVLAALEILTLIKVGSWLGALPTLGLLMLAAITGMLVLRWQGLSMAVRMREILMNGQWPAREMMSGMIVMLAGILLILPGFLSDLVALLLLLPWVRQALIGHLPIGPAPEQGNSRTQYIIEGEFHRESPEENKRIDH
ncbi:MAG: FxsA family protein [Chromatiales bacterium]|jgi:UPF0716 protein FxsA|nr:FxsA family protein [Chromatiales bacterium]